MNSIFMFAFTVENNLLLNMISIDVDVFVFVCLGVENTHSVLKGEAEMQIVTHVDHFGHSIHQNVAFRFHL